jgi:hypothetical protein
VARHDLVVALRDLAILLAGVVGGGQLLMMWVVSTAANRASPHESLRLHQMIMSTDLPDRYIQPAGILSFFTGAVLLGVGPRHAADVILIAIGMASIVGIAVLTRAVNRPINRELGTWTDANLAEYPAQRRRWDRSHAVRTALGMLAFAVYIVLASR